MANLFNNGYSGDPVYPPNACIQQPYIPIPYSNYPPLPNCGPPPLNSILSLQAPRTRMIPPAIYPPIPPSLCEPQPLDQGCYVPQYVFTQVDVKMITTVGDIRRKPKSIPYKYQSSTKGNKTISILRYVTTEQLNHMYAQPPSSKCPCGF
ncbi:hypothetical protein ACOME3_005453 [Neoechinorhynchus agilis]